MYVADPVKKKYLKIKNLRKCPKKAPFRLFIGPLAKRNPRLVTSQGSFF